MISLLLCLAAGFSYINERYIKLPTTIGLMLISLLLSMSLIGLHHLGLHLDTWAASILSRIDFSETLLNGMLSFLLFAGALHINLNDLAKEFLQKSYPREFKSITDITSEEVKKPK